MRNGNFYANQGPVGTLNRTPLNFSQVANPWVYRHVVSVSGTKRPAPKVAGKHVGACCAACAQKGG